MSHNLKPSFFSDLAWSAIGETTSDEELEHWGGEEITEVGDVATVDGDRGDKVHLPQLILS